VELIIPTNWDDALITKVRGMPIKEFYGKFPSDYFGGGRPSSFFPSVKAKHIRHHIDIIHKCGYQFDYLLNATCMDNVEFSRVGQHRMHKFIDQLVESGVDIVTVSIPYLVHWIKKNYPSLKIKASIMANIDTLYKAKQWQSWGVDSMTLGLECNRDFPLLKSILENVKCDIALIANLGCIKSCALSQYHYLLISHASQSEHRINHFFINYCGFFCAYLRLVDPSRFISSGWIRPEDIVTYEKIGISYFKIIDRAFPTDKIVKIARAYVDKLHDGNLLDLIVAYREESSFTLEKFVRVSKCLVHPSKIRLSFLRKLFKLLVKNYVFINNRDLDGFLDSLRDKDCRLNDCDICRHCHKIAEKVVKIDPEYKKNLEKSYKEILEDLETGDAFRLGL